MRDMIRLLEDLLGFRVIRQKGDGEIPSKVWFEEGLQLVHDPDFMGAEGRLHHLGILVSDKNAIAKKCIRYGLSELQPYWFALPDGLVLELIEK